MFSFCLNKKPLNSQQHPRSKVKGRRCRFRREHRGGFVDTTCHLVRKKMGEAGSSESRGEMTMSLRSSLTTQQRATVTVDRADLATVTFKFYYREGPSYFACHPPVSRRIRGGGCFNRPSPPPTHTVAPFAIGIGSPNLATVVFATCFPFWLFPHLELSL